jgi:histidyl-tRNA synthetase
VIEGAPKLMDFLGNASKAHLATVTAVLEANGLPYVINPRLVRGMDYYNLTVFEFVTTELGSQGTICAGGRYDYLMEQIGGKPAPAVGWAMGVERVLELLKANGSAIAPPTLDAYAITADATTLPQVMGCLENLRRYGVTVQMQASTPEGMPSLKSQFKRADASGARFALVFGPDELVNGSVTVKALRDASIPQRLHSLDELSVLAESLQSHA